MIESPAVFASAIFAAIAVFGGFFFPAFKTWHAVGSTQGAMIGMGMFICVPLVYVGLTGSLPLAPEFSSTSLLSVYADENFLFLLYLSLVTVSTSFILFIMGSVKTRAGISALKFDRLDAQMVISAGVVFHAVGSLWIFLESYGSDEGHWYRSREEAVERLGTIAIVSSYALTGGRLIVAAMFTRSLLLYGPRVWSTLLIVVWVGFDMFVTGNRIGALLVMVGTLGYLIELKRFRVLLVGAIVVPILGIAFAAFAFFRPYLQSGGSVSQIIELGVSNFDQSTELGAVIALGAVESVNLNTLSSVYESIDESTITYGSSYLRSLVFLIPRSIWPDKPETITQVAGDAFAGGNTSLGVLFVGEALYSFGFLGPFIAPFLLILLVAAISRFAQDVVLSRALLLLCSFVWVRMPFDSVTLWTLFALLAVLAGLACAKVIRSLGISGAI